MGILVQASLAQDAVFFAGDKISCTITFYHQPSNAAHPLSKSVNAGECSFDDSATDLESIPESGRSSLDSIYTQQSMDSLDSRFTNLFIAPNFSGYGNKHQADFFNNSPVANKNPEHRLYQDPEDASLFNLKFVRRKTASLSSWFSFSGSSDTSNSRKAPVNLDGVKSSVSNGYGNLQRTQSSDGLTAPLSPKSASMARSSSSPCASFKTEYLMWGFAQVVGHFVINGSIIKFDEFESLKSKTMYRSANGIGSGGSVGGGIIGVPTAGGTTSSVAELQKGDGKMLPVLSTPPSILFCDLELAPGESKSYTFDFTLPVVLPPSHRGKAIRVSYNFLLGAQRGGHHSRAQIVQMPFRVFSKLNSTGFPSPYDLMSPTIINKDEATVDCARKDTAEEQKKVNKDVPTDAIIDKIFSLSSADSAHTSEESASISSLSATNEAKNIPDQGKSLEIASSVCQKFSKVTFNISKGDEPLAQFSMMKTAFQLGDVVTGTLMFTNTFERCYQVSVTLESMEVVETPFANKSPKQIETNTRKIHAEHHEFCLNTLRTNIMLSIPPYCTPGFKTSAVSLEWYLRIKLIIGVNERLPMRPTHYDVNHTHIKAIDYADSETFDCRVPIQIYPVSYGSARIYNHVQIFPIS
ncbi:Rgp1-domain-containing protein [Basidiobolus meristosporus CBS 931.73]|uniref:Rgp1-domain-containing protein n=1 Tax=Basidiobolus meristosporus CBS 931.73 TaxID=1314790 RepID=A0A1Y1Z232_9FUNG|nr:Rgp1-domain-containing protein [Basidiobolus meristosporus CBS 931.73]|eukprot:ORY03977.1 Rgp1-domain-containing protein [Basidiobolus meristosporus CBS 931.73]